MTDEYYDQYLNIHIEEFLPKELAQNFLPLQCTLNSRGGTFEAG